METQLTKQTSTSTVMWLPRDLIFASQDWPLVLRKRRKADRRCAPPRACAPAPRAGAAAPRLITDALYPVTSSPADNG